MTTKLKNKLNNLPLTYGIYIFLGKDKNILYVGKAKKLRNRVRNYFTKSSNLTSAKLVMVNKIDDIDHTVVDTEAEALLLETNLIKKYKPPYNIMLKDDKHWQWIKIDHSTLWANIYMTRHLNLKRQEKTKYFGPFTSALIAKETLRQIKKLFPICLNLPNEPKQTLKPCFNYHLGRCPGPCTGEISAANYAKLFDNVTDFLKGNHKLVAKRFEQKMKFFSKNKKYELAAKMRNTYLALKKLNQKQKVVTNKDENIDLINMFRNEDTVAINLFKIRQGKMINKFNTLIKDTQHDNTEVIKSFIEQYYSITTDTPKEIYIPSPINLNKFNDIKIKTTQRGRKAQLIELSKHNAHEYFKQQETFFDRPIKLEIKQEEALKELKQILKLKNIPKRIETYDIANIQGVSAVGGMSVFIDGKPKKSQYRKFIIKSLNEANDPLMMAEIITRRLGHISWSKPNLIVLDGGKGQLSQVNKVMKKMKDKTRLIALAKKEEDIYIVNKKNPIKFSRRSPALQLLQQSRDEVHRYSNSFFQKIHKQKNFQSSLDEISGIGPSTKRILKKKFGPVNNIKKASYQDLTKLIGKHKTKLIKEHFSSS